MLSLLKNYVGDAAAPLIFLVLFLAIVGGSLWITPRLSAWLDKKAAANKSYFDGILEKDPNQKSEEEQGESHV